MTDVHLAFETNIPAHEAPSSRLTCPIEKLCTFAGSRFYDVPGLGVRPLPIGLRLSSLRIPTHQLRLSSAFRAITDHDTIFPECPYAGSAAPPAGSTTAQTCGDRPIVVTCCCTYLRH